MDHFDGGPGADLKWAIPARHINTLFGELIPRVAAGVWIDASDPQDGAFGEFTWPPPNTDAHAKVLEWIAKFVDEGGAEAGGIPSSQTFRDQLVDLRTYLRFDGNVDNGSGGNVDPVLMPIRFVAQGGHDFLLSSDGMDLFGPPSVSFDPAGQKDVLWYYTFRETGKRSIGMPTEFGTQAVYSQPSLVEAPTGASQLDLPVDILTQLIPCMPADAPLEFCGVIDAARERVEKLLDIEAPPGTEVIEEIRCLLVEGLRMKQKVWTEIEQLLCSKHWKKGLDLICQWLEKARPEDCRPVTVELFECSQVFLRDWQLTGAVFRAIQEVFPRIIADFWHDNVELATPPPFDKVSSNVREEVRNRLETGLPPANKMVFELDDAGIPTHWNGTVWDPKDIMVTNQGIFFPAEPEIPDIGSILVQIVSGRAGNPVFTATWRST